MKTIPLTQNKEAIIDDIDFDRVSSVKWYYARRHVKKVSHLPGYAVRNLRLENGKRKTQYLHDFILEVDGQKVAYINGDTLDNRRENLRIATLSEIQRNKRNQIKKKVKYKGVDFHKKSRKYRARIQANGKLTALGEYATDVEAARAYDCAARKYFGLSAAVNFPLESEQPCDK